MKLESGTSFRRGIVLACLALVTSHILICCYLHFFPSGPLTGNRIASFYKTKILIGPFFIADRLKVSPHLMISYKKTGENWSAFTDEAMENVKTYQHNPWRYGIRAQGIFLRGAGKKFSNQRRRDSVNIWKSNEFITLNSYLVREVLPKQVDSIKLIYILNTFDAATDKVVSDTSWTLAYKLNDQIIR